MRDSFSQLSSGLFIASILVYLVMVVQFRSFLDPLIVLLTVPLGYVGVAIVLFLTQTNLSVPALMGIVMMVGIVIGSGIFLTTGIIANSIPSIPLILLAWLIGGFLIWAGAWTYAELGSALPEVGGQYV